MLTIAVLGYGYWGPNLARNFLSAGCYVKAIVDIEEKNLNKAKKLYPSIQLIKRMDAVLQDDEIDAIIIALPVRLHYEVAKQALLSGKHVLIEKPMTQSVEQAQELIRIAKERGLVLMPDHTFLYTGAVQKIKELSFNNELGKLLYFDSVRVNLGLFQQDINVLWDLAPHDLSILHYISMKTPCSVSATGFSHTESGLEDIAYLTIFYENGFIAHITASWISPVKLRKILLGGDRKMVVYDDIEPTEKIKLYDSGYIIKDHEDANRLKIDYRTGDIFVPKLDMTEALHALACDFVRTVKTKQAPISSANIGLEVVKVLEAAQLSIKNCGKEVALQK